MSALRTIRHNITQAVQQSGMGISKAALAELPATREEGARLILLLHPIEQLAQYMFALPRYHYPLHFMMNTWLAYSAVVDETQRREMRLRTCELGIAALAGVPTGKDWGTVIDTDTRVLQTPAAEISENMASIHHPSPSQLWGAALLIDSWPMFMASGPADSHAPELFVVHLPDRQMTEEEELKVATMAIGYNYCEMFPGANQLVNSTVHEIREALAVAETIAIS